MQEPQNKSELQQFLGCITYLSRFIPNFSDKTAVLRDLLKKDSEYIWEPHHQKVFDDLKQEVSTSSLLYYYDPNKPVYLYCDASGMGIGAALLQPAIDDSLHPVAFASKSLTTTEQRYACIERELLAIVFGTNRFHTYLNGRSFHVYTDHNPLVMILNKPITCAPPRLQRMLITLSDYNMTISYHPGTKNKLADGLSRFPNPNNNSSIELDLRVDFVQFSSSKIEQLQHDTMCEPMLQILKDIIIAGWPETINDLPTDVRPFWSIQDQLSIHNGIIMKGQQLVIPNTMHQYNLKTLHTAHMRKEKTQLLAKNTVYWPTINADISRQCKVCLEHQRTQHAEPLQPHDVPSTPWTVLGADLFELHGTQYLIVADYYSKFPVIKKLKPPAPSALITNTMKDIFELLGVPEKIVR